MEPEIHYRVYKNALIPKPCATFRNKLACHGEELLATRPTPKLENHSCRLSATAYLVYSQLTD